ncbi:MAG TPA: hypothetical protein VFJ47_13325 [Terriglobales bacterium]|nr:hypothetical protein [Terriglobales bacterium]
MADQEASGQKPGPLCRERGIGEWSFYKWRRRLRQADTVELAVLETRPARVAVPDSGLELVLRNGERLRTATGVDVATLRLVVDAVRS